MGTAHSRQVHFQLSSVHSQLSTVHSQLSSVHSQLSWGNTSSIQRSLVAYSPPSHPPPLPSLEAGIVNRGCMEGESSATSGSQHNYRLTAMPSSAGTNPPTTCPVTTRLLEVYQECIENDVWVRVLYEGMERVEKLTFFHKLTPPLCQPGR